MTDLLEYSEYSTSSVIWTPLYQALEKSVQISEFVRINEAYW